MVVAKEPVASAVSVRVSSAWLLRWIASVTSPEAGKPEPATSISRPGTTVAWRSGSAAATVAGRTSRVARTRSARGTRRDIVLSAVRVELDGGQTPPGAVRFDAG